MSTLSLTINHLGFKQYVDEADEYVCVQCHQPYTNEGEGVICGSCDQLNEHQDAIEAEG